MFIHFDWNIFMEQVQYSNLIVSLLDTYGLVLKHQGSSIHGADDAFNHFFFKYDYE